MDNKQPKIITTEELMNQPDKPVEYTEDAPKVRKNESVTWEMDNSLESKKAYALVLDALNVNGADVAVEDKAILQDIAKYAIQNARSTNPSKLFSYIKKVMRGLPTQNLRMLRRELIMSGGEL